MMLILCPWCGPRNQIEFIYGGDANRGKAPPCDPQAPLGSLLGQAGMFPHLEPLP